MRLDFRATYDFPRVAKDFALLGEDEQGQVLVRVLGSDQVREALSKLSERMEMAVLEASTRMHVAKFPYVRTRTGKVLHIRTSGAGGWGTRCGLHSFDESVFLVDSQHERVCWTCRKMPRLGLLQAGRWYG